MRSLRLANFKQTLATQGDTVSKTHTALQLSYGGLVEHAQRPWARVSHCGEITQNLSGTGTFMDLIFNMYEVIEASQSHK